MNITGIGHTKKIEKPKIIRNKILDVILLPGIGDIIYTWYKLIHYVNDGYSFNVKILDCHPQRSHQIHGCLDGMKSFEYIKGFEYYQYWLKNINDIRTPPHNSMFNNMPVLHVNSFLETGQHIDSFMPNYPAIYDVNIKTNQDAEIWSEQNINQEYCNIILYTSSYENNISCQVHPDPQYWADLALLCYEVNGSNKPLNVYCIGASYDADLTMDTYKKLVEMKIKAELLLDQDFYNIIELIRNIDVVICYESGFAMIADCLNVPLYHIIRCQGGDRKDKEFPFLGPINPEGFYKRYWPIFYDETIDEIEKKIR